jgi:hypothetical protein
MGAALDLFPGLCALSIQVYFATTDGFNSQLACFEETRCP